MGLQMRLEPSLVSSASIPAIWYYRNESGFLNAHMGIGVERGLKSHIKIPRVVFFEKNIVFEWDFN